MNLERPVSTLGASELSGYDIRATDRAANGLPAEFKPGWLYKTVRDGGRLVVVPDRIRPVHHRTYSASAPWAGAGKEESWIAQASVA